MIPDRRLSIGTYSLGLDPYMGEDPTQIDPLAMASNEDKPLQNGQHYEYRKS